MKTYSIAAAELKKIIELVNTGYQCTGSYRINKSFNRMEEFCGNTDFLKGRNL